MKRPIQIKMSNKLKENLKIHSAKTGDTMTDIINLALIQYLERENKNNG